MFIACIVRTMAAFLASCILAGSALAAPFCLQTQLVTPQCIYYDAHDCQLRASQLRGSCAANPAEIKLVRGAGEYCVTNGSILPARCDYVGLEDCLRDAARVRGSCLKGPPANIVEQGQGIQSNPSQPAPVVPGSGFGFGTSFAGTHP